MHAGGMGDLGFAQLHLKENGANGQGSGILQHVTETRGKVSENPLESDFIMVTMVFLCSNC